MSGRPRTGVHRRTTGHWRLDAANASPGDLSSQALSLLNALTQDLVVWQDLSTRFEIDLFCGLFMGDENEGEDLSAQVVRALGERGIKLSLDIYAPNPPDADKAEVAQNG